MYSYGWDIETGGLLLNSSPTQMSKEPRPVYAAELDLLGFGKYWRYERQNDTPYLWAEANKYWYRGRLVAETKGGKKQTRNGENGFTMYGESGIISTYMNVRNRYA